MATGDLAYTPFNHQHPFPPDLRMQRDTINARDVISAPIRWEGMLVYVLENQKTYQLQGGLTNEYWVEFLGSGGGDISNAVLYTIQTLTPEQQLQARINIGAGELMDGLLALGAVTAEVNDVTIASALARINGVNVGQNSPTTINVPVPAEGYTRRDLIVIGDDSIIYLVEGIEVLEGEPALTPDVPEDTVVLVETFSNDTGLQDFYDFAYASFVRFDISTQGLSPAQRLNARTNIQALSRDTNDSRTGTLTQTGLFTLNGDYVQVVLNDTASARAWQFNNPSGGGAYFQRRGGLSITAKGDSTTNYFIIRGFDTTETEVFRVRAGGVTKGGDAINNDDFVTLGQVTDLIEGSEETGFTELSGDDFFIGYRVNEESERIEVIFDKTDKDVIVTDTGNIILNPSTSVANFIFTGTGVAGVTELRGIEGAIDGREIHLTNRSGDIIPIIDSYVGGPANSAFGFAYDLADGETISLIGLDGEWIENELNEVAFSDNLDSVNAIKSIGEDGIEVWNGYIDQVTKEQINYKELTYTPDFVDNRIFKQVGGKYFGDSSFLNRREFNVLKFGADPTGVNYSDISLDRIRQIHKPGDKILFPLGDYKFENIQTFNKSVDIDGGNSNIITDARDFIVVTGTEKLTTTVTSNYTEITSRDSIVLTSVAGIEVGDIINIISTELFDSARDYQYKGGNFLVTGISGNTVSFNGAMPFDITAASIEVKIYDAPKVKIHNFNHISNSQDVGDTLYGVRIIYCKNSYIGNIETDNFRYNIDTYRCVNVELGNIKTGHAKDPGDTFDAYGVSIESCTNVTSNNVITNSGQHGMTNGGREPSYNLSFNQCVMKSELTDHGWGSHSNAYTVTFNQCSFFGFSITGNITFNECVFNKFEGNNNIIGVRENPRFANYTFNNCPEISGEIRIRHYYQTYVAERKNIGSIIFNNCSNVYLRTEVSLLTTENQIADINLVRFQDCENARLFITDNIKNLFLNNVTKQSGNRLVDMTVTGDRQPSVKSIEITNFEVNASTSALRIRNADYVYLNNITYLSGITQPQQIGEFYDVERLIIEDSDLSDSERHFEIFGTLDYLRIINSQINFLSGGAFDSLLTAVGYIHTDNLENQFDDLSYNIRTSSNGTKYNESINSTGRKLIGTNTVAYLSDLPTTGTLLRASRNYTIDSTSYLDSYIRWTYSGGLSSTQTIAPNVFSAEDEIIGEVEGTGPTFAPGAGVNLRTPTSQGLFAPTGSRVSIKFKSANDALVTIIKPYEASTAPDASLTVKGIVELATDAETLTGTDTVRAITPSNLQAKLNALILTASPTLDFGDIAAGDSAVLTATVTGAVLGDNVNVAGIASIYGANAMIDAWVSSADTVSVRVRNFGGSTINPASGVFKIKVFK